MVASTTTTATDAREAHEAALALTARARASAHTAQAAEPPAADDPGWAYTTIHVGGSDTPGELTVYRAPFPVVHVGLDRGAWVVSDSPDVLLDLADAFDPSAQGSTSVGPWRVRDTAAVLSDRIIEAGHFYLQVDAAVRGPVATALRDAADQLHAVRAEVTT